jgi:hypothetical protein
LAMSASVRCGCPARRHASRASPQKPRSASILAIPSHASPVAGFSSSPRRYSCNASFASSFGTSPGAHFSVMASASQTCAIGDCGCAEIVLRSDVSLSLQFRTVNPVSAIPATVSTARMTFRTAGFAAARFAPASRQIPNVATLQSRRIAPRPERRPARSAGPVTDRPETRFR